MTLTALLGRMVKAALHPERRMDRRGVTQVRWIAPPHAPPQPRGPITQPIERPGHGVADPDQRVMYMVSTSSTLHGAAGHLGVMVNAHTTGTHQGVKEGRPWAMDNGAYSGRFDPEVFMDALERWRDLNSSCRFVVAPDVLGDGAATEAQLERWRAAIREMGFPVAFAAHRGTTELPNCDALFIPASNLDDPALPGLIQQARSRGLWVHVGRVNSARRMRLCAQMDADSADGTHVKYKGLERGLSDIAGWTEQSAQGRTLRLLLSTTVRGRVNEEAWDRARFRDHARLYGDTPLYPPSGNPVPPGTPAYHGTGYGQERATLPEGYDGHAPTVLFDRGDGRAPEHLPIQRVMLNHGNDTFLTSPRAVARMPERRTP